ncbi:hypothetical protein CJ030_MR6G028564 [Morella rubra]|uniref:Uncharacterized protein n=1 Tax=Morella rubra TaxID=262757 RepID=A0A6A1V9Z6_9ROSI|nr:hypothetical protein CJ030_MR6G028564 [Morella rubra]
MMVPACLCSRSPHGTCGPQAPNHSSAFASSFDSRYLPHSSRPASDLFLQPLISPSRRRIFHHATPLSPAPSCWSLHSKLFKGASSTLRLSLLRRQLPPPCAVVVTIYGFMNPIVAGLPAFRAPSDSLSVGLLTFCLRSRPSRILLPHL